MPLQGGTGLGKPLKSTIHPLRTEIPIYLGAEGPKNVALAGRDLRRLAAAVLLAQGGRASTAAASPRASPPAATRARPTRFEVACHDDRSSPATTSSSAPTWSARSSPCTPAAWAPRAPTSTSRCSPGWATRTWPPRSRSSTSPGKRQEAAAAIPLAMVEDVALVGPPDKIRDELTRGGRRASPRSSSAVRQVAADLRRAGARLKELTSVIAE